MTLPTCRYNSHPVRTYREIPSQPEGPQGSVRKRVYSCCRFCEFRQFVFTRSVEHIEAGRKSPPATHRVLRDAVKAWKRAERRKLKTLRIIR